MKSKLDNEIKKRLENREIQPSENAWQKIEFLLHENQSDKKKNRPLFFFWLAASVVVLVGLLFLFSDNKSQKIFRPTALNKEKLLKPVELQKITNTDLAKNEIDKKNEIVKASTKSISKRNVEENINKITSLKIVDTSQSKVINDVQKKLVVNNFKDNPAIKPVETTIVQKKTTEFVDADMLLFSVEHNHNLPKKEPSAKLVIIDFNK